MQEYQEKRDFPRMTMDSVARFRIEGEGVIGEAVVKDLSSGGLQLWTDSEIQSGSKLNVEIVPVKDITPPLRVVVEVVRSTPLAEGDGTSYAIACNMIKMLGADEVGADFP